MACSTSRYQGAVGVELNGEGAEEEVILGAFRASSVVRISMVMPLAPQLRDALVD